MAPCQSTIASPMAPQQDGTTAPPPDGTTASTATVGGAWTTQRDRRDQREIQREELRRLKIEWQDKLWLVQNHPCDDAVLAWLSENRAECSKIGSSRWHLETLPHLLRCQDQLRRAADFAASLDAVPAPTVTLQPLTTAAATPFSTESASQFSTKSGNDARNTTASTTTAKRRKRRDAGMARPTPKRR